MKTIGAALFLLVVAGRHGLNLNAADWRRAVRGA